MRARLALPATCLTFFALACTGGAAGDTATGWGPAPEGNICDPDSPTTCGEDQDCLLWEGDGQHYCTCPEGTEQVGRNCLEEGDDGLKPTCSTLEEDACDAVGFCYDLDEESCEYMEDRDIEPPEECAEIEPAGNAMDTIGICVSSVQDPSANPYAPEAGYCTFTQFWSNPTVLPVDCRCAQPFEVYECKRPQNLDSSVSFGDGPRFKDISTLVLYGADLDEREILVAGSWESSTLDDQGVIFAVDLDSGDRRVVSGSYTDPSLGTTSEGTGPDFVNAYNVRVGADGDYYVVGGQGLASAPVVFRVDPDSGDRTLVFEGRSEDFAACDNGVPLDESGTKEINYDPMSWTMDEDGNHYFAVYAGAPGPGVVQVSADGQSCSYLTRIVQDPDSRFEDVGDGYSDIQFYFTALEIVGETMYALSDKQLYTIEMDTGRRRLFSDAETGTVGSGGNLGQNWLKWDPYHEVLWSYGTPSDSNILTAVDPDTGDRIGAPCWHPTLGRLEGCAGNSVGIGGVMRFGGMVIDPQPPHDLFNAYDNSSVIQTDQATLNVNVRSL